MKTAEQLEFEAAENVRFRLDDHERGVPVFYRLRSTPTAQWIVVPKSGHFWTTANEYRTLNDFRLAAGKPVPEPRNPFKFIDDDAARYQRLRDIALKRGGLEAFVAINQLDHERDADQFDRTVDRACEGFRG